MRQIWAPWRMQYIAMDKSKGCILCDKPREDNDVSNYVLYRGNMNFIIMNAYPYNPGHLMVAPYRHTASMDLLTREELYEHFEIVSRGIRALKQALKPEGFNVGINMSRIAGAGIEDHFHTHIVPRWEGDTNFMPVIADTKVVPQALAGTYEKLRGEFQDA
jgi:ATP adenylyltransferase